MSDRHADSKPAQWHERLRDGTEVLIRPIRREDADLEREFIEGMSAELRYFRFLQGFMRPSPELIEKLTDIDHTRDAAFVALVDENRREKIIGVSRYFLDEDDQSAECAVGGRRRLPEPGPGFSAHAAPDRACVRSRCRSVVFPGGGRQSLDVEFRRAYGFWPRDRSPRLNPGIALDKFAAAGYTAANATAFPTAPPEMKCEPADYPLAALRGTAGDANDMNTRVFRCHAAGGFASTQ